MQHEITPAFVCEWRWQGTGASDYAVVLQLLRLRVNPKGVYSWFVRVHEVCQQISVAGAFAVSTLGSVWSKYWCLLNAF